MTEDQNPPSFGDSTGRPQRAPRAISGFFDPRRLALVLRHIDAAPACSTPFLLRRLQDDVAWQLLHPLGPKGGLHVSGSGLHDLRQELLSMGWLADDSPRQKDAPTWLLSATGEEVLARHAESPERLARRWCIDSGRAENIVARLLDRLWRLAPSSQGQVLFAVSSTLPDPPSETQDLGPYLEQLGQRLLVSWIDLWCPEWPHVLPASTLTQVGFTPPMSRSWLLSWSRLRSMAARKSAVQRVLSFHLRSILFGDLLPTEDVEIWQRRMEWAGLSLLTTTHETGARHWFPVGSFGTKAHPAFQAVSELQQDGRPYAIFAPAWEGFRKTFCDTLVWAYQIEQTLAGTTHASLLAVRDHVCLRLRLGHFRFVSCLQQAFAESVRGLLPFHIMLEVDRSPRERQRQAMALPIVIDEAPRYIVSIHRR